MGWSMTLKALLAEYGFKHGAARRYILVMSNDGG
jgi:hypothetical protein